MPGRDAASCSGDNPRLLSVPGRYPWLKTSPSRTRLFSVFRSAGWRRSSRADSLPCPVSYSWSSRAAHGVAGFLAAENLERGGAVVREIGVDVAPPPVLGRVHAHDGIAVAAHLDAVDLQIGPAAQRGGRVPQIDRDFLTLAGAQLPQIGGREP